MKEEERMGKAELDGSPVKADINVGTENAAAAIRNR